MSALVLALGVAGTAAAAQAGVRVFVTNEKSDDVTVIDAAPARSSRPSPWASDRAASAISPDGRRVYVANSNSDSLSVIDTATLAVLDTVPAGVDPEGLTLEPGRRRDLRRQRERAVRDRPRHGHPESSQQDHGGNGAGDGRACRPTGGGSPSPTRPPTTCTSSTRRRLRSSKVAVPKNPRGMRFTSDGRRLWVASEGADSVSIIDMASMTVVRSAPTGGERPVDIVFTPRRPPGLCLARAVRRRARSRRGDARGGGRHPGRAARLVDGARARRSLPVGDHRAGG